MQCAQHVIVCLQRGQIVVPHLQHRHRETTADRRGRVGRARRARWGAEIVKRVRLLLRGEGELYLFKAFEKKEISFSSSFEIILLDCKKTISALKEERKWKNNRQI